jgi:hypothetical protein
MHDESRPHTLQALGEYVPLVQTHPHGDQVKSDPGACDGSRIAGAKIALDQPVAVSGRNADAVV